MHRRRVLLGVATGIVGAVAGCSGNGAGGTTTDATPGDPRTTPETTRTTAGRSGPAGPDRRVPTVAGRDLPIPREELVDGVPPGAIRAIVDPAFGTDWSGVSITLPEGDSEVTYRPRLTDGDPVIGVERDGAARAYPLRILNSHEIVNDVFGDPILVSYCPVCASGVVASRVIRGEPATFDVSGLLWKLNLVMVDDVTRSLWAQAAATAIRGELTGARLDLLPATLTKWGAWRESHPATEVLLPPPLSKPRYHGQPGYETAGSYVADREGGSDPPTGAGEDLNRGKFTHVLGVSVDGTAKAYPLPVVVEEGVINDAVGGFPVVVSVAPGRSLVAYDRRVDGRTLTFAEGDDQHLRGGRSRWLRSTGTAVDGPYAGRSLDRATFVPQMFWATWVDFNPETDVYGDFTFEREDP